MTPNDSVDANAVSSGRRSERKPRFYNVRLPEGDAWFAATMASLFNVLGMLLEVALVRTIPGISLRPAAISAFVGLIFLMTLFSRRKTPSLLWASVVYSLNNASVITALLWTNLQFADLERNWVPFQASKLGCLVAAILAPEFGVGLLSILAYSLSALLQFEFFFPTELKARVAAAEPWPILAFGLAGVLALIYRFRHALLEQEVARFQAQNFAIRELANAFLNIRDLMNTPLQVIEISVNMLRNSNETPPAVLDRIDRSVQGLRKFIVLLAPPTKDIALHAQRAQAAKCL